MIPAHTGAEEKKIEVRAKRFFFVKTEKQTHPHKKTKPKLLKPMKSHTPLLHLLQVREQKVPPSRALCRNRGER